MDRANQSLHSWVAVGSNVFFSGKLGNVKVHFVTGYFDKENPQIVSKDKDLVDRWFQNESSPMSLNSDSQTHE